MRLLSFGNESRGVAVTRIIFSEITESRIDFACELPVGCTITPSERRSKPAFFAQEPSTTRVIASRKLAAVRVLIIFYLSAIEIPNIIPEIGCSKIICSGSLKGYGIVPKRGRDG
jgi:hypothetical protein